MKTKETQDKKVLDWLMSGNPISSMKAIKMWRHTRLSRSINTLRKTHDIYGKMVLYGKSRFKIYYTKECHLYDLYGKNY